MRISRLACLSFLTVAIGTPQLRAEVDRTCRVIVENGSLGGIYESASAVALAVALENPTEKNLTATCEYEMRKMPSGQQISAGEVVLEATPARTAGDCAGSRRHSRGTRWIRLW